MTKQKTQLQEKLKDLSPKEALDFLMDGSLLQDFSQEEVEEEYNKIKGDETMENSMKHLESIQARWLNECCKNGSCPTCNEQFSEPEQKRCDICQHKFPDDKLRIVVDGDLEILTCDYCYTDLEGEI